MLSAKNFGWKRNWKKGIKIKPRTAMKTTEINTLSLEQLKTRVQELEQQLADNDPHRVKTPEEIVAILWSSTDIATHKKQLNNMLIDLMRFTTDTNRRLDPNYYVTFRTLTETMDAAEEYKWDLESKEKEETD